MDIAKRNEGKKLGSASKIVMGMSPNASIMAESEIPNPDGRNLIQPESTPAADAVNIMQPRWSDIVEIEGSEEAVLDKFPSVPDSLIAIKARNLLSKLTQYDVAVTKGYPIIDKRVGSVGELQRSPLLGRGRAGTVQRFRGGHSGKMQDQRSGLPVDR
ncbi:hypothetical protein LOK49_LG06G02915 [Camellia lanceoleosa]|uniref:Uncharacterized protein n=1 Tax=Camellia lanceoleosa TaxID=1840588 RepID=A0ACC0H791_9ERIC|nr:hypothetical protein LOK49_LG06G02915 [Camellia lanceoleosa]